MTRSFQYLLLSLRFRLIPSLVLFLLALLQMTGRQNESIHLVFFDDVPFLLALILPLLSLSLGFSGCSTALALGGRRTDLFGGLQGGVLILTGDTLLLCAALHLLTRLAGQSPSQFWPSVYPHLLAWYAAASFALALWGILAGLLLRNGSPWAFRVGACLLLFAFGLYLLFAILASAPVSQWSAPCWGFFLAPFLLCAAGELLLHRLIRRLTV